jgi:hypothetical protein
MTEQKPNPAALAAVREKRGEIVGIIAELERQIASHRSDLLHIDYTLRLLDPGLRSPRRGPRKSGSSARAISRRAS